MPGLLATHTLVLRVTRCPVALGYVGMEFGKRKSNRTLKERARGEEEGCGRALKSLARNLNMAQARRAGASRGVWDGPWPGAHLPQPRMLGTWPQPQCPPLLSLAEAPGWASGQKGSDEVKCDSASELNGPAIAKGCCCRAGRLGREEPSPHPLWRVCRTRSPPGRRGAVPRPEAPGGSHQTLFLAERSRSMQPGGSAWDQGASSHLLSGRGQQ